MVVLAAAAAGGGGGGGAAAAAGGGAAGAAGAAGAGGGGGGGAAAAAAAAAPSPHFHRPPLDRTTRCLDLSLLLFHVFLSLKAATNLFFLHHEILLSKLLNLLY